LNLINSYHQNIKFTFEIKKQSKIPFLDLLLIRVNNTIIMDWYQKPTASNRILNYRSAHPYQMKINIAQALLNRITNLSDPQFHKKNWDIIKKILITNNYPEQTVKRMINRMKYKRFKNNETKNININEKKYTKFTYIPGLSEKIQKITSKNEHIQLGMKPPNILLNIYSNTKTKINKMDQHGGVYLIPTQKTSKNDKIYIGETKRKYGQRMKEHKSEQNKMIEKRQFMINTLHQNNNGRTRKQLQIREQEENEIIQYLTTESKTALTTYAVENNINFDFERMKILHNETNWFKRKTLESLYIQANKEKSINYKIDTINIDPQMKQLIELTKSFKST